MASDADAQREPQPDWWRWRYMTNYGWSKWIALNDDEVAAFRDLQHHNLDAGRVELQPLYACQITEGERQWVSPIKTVADLVNDLLTLDQGMEVHGAYFLPGGVPDRCRTRGLSLSREHVANGRIKRDDAIPYSLVIWTAQEGGQ